MKKCQCHGPEAVHPALEPSSTIQAASDTDLEVMDLEARDRVADLEVRVAELEAETAAVKADRERCWRDSRRICLELDRRRILREVAKV